MTIESFHYNYLVQETRAGEEKVRYVSHRTAHLRPSRKGLTWFTAVLVYLGRAGRNLLQAAIPPQIKHY